MIVHRTGDGYAGQVAEAVAEGSGGTPATGTGLLPNHARRHTRDDVDNLGGSTGLITATPSDASADERVPGDIATAKAFGQRVRAVAQRLAG